MSPLELVPPTTMNDNSTEPGRGEGDPDPGATLRRLRGAGVTPLRRPRTRFISITGGKGGVGKSTVAANLAVTYGRRGARTLAIDGDLAMADLNLMLGLAPSRSMLDVIEGCSEDEILIAAHGIHLLPALNGSYRLANLDRHSREAVLSAVERLTHRFDTLIVDTAAGIGEMAVALAGSAREVIVVATPEPLSLADAYASLKALSTRWGVQRAFLLPNEVRSPSEAEDVVARLDALVHRFLGIELVPLPPIPYDALVPEAAAAGVPLVLYSPDCAASRAFQRVARRLDALRVAEAETDGAERSGSGAPLALPVGGTEVER